MPAADMPAAEVDISVDLVRALIASQVPELAGLPVEPLAFGWDNALFLVGDSLVARLPRRLAGVALVESEQRWLPELAPRLPLPIPAPVHCGVPGDGYPWPWSICPYVPGISVLDLFERGDALADPVAEAERLGAFLHALHQPAPADAPANSYRGVPLAERDERLRAQVGELGASIDGPRLLERWDAALELPPWTGAPVWLHGDVHPGNVIATDGRIVGVVDFGDITSGDPAVDLAGGWMFFAPPARAAFRRAARADDRTWATARAWALCLGVATLAHSADNPPFARHARRTIAAVLADDA